MVDRQLWGVVSVVAGKPQACHGEAWYKILQAEYRGDEGMAKAEKRTRLMVIKFTQSEFDELEQVAGHYKKSDYVRKAIKVQMASDRIRGKVTD